jgi:hypothetical protein
MIGVRGERQFKVESLKLKARKETLGKRFNAEDAESTEIAEPESDREGREGLTAETLSAQRSER